jgi:antitoxin VapB
MAITNSVAKPAAPVKTAKLFKNGRSQAVRLPKEFRFEGTEVEVRRDAATGNVLLLQPFTPPVEREIFSEDSSGSGADAERKLTLPELYAIFDQAEFPDDFFQRETHIPRELDLF